jgi:hypothetical protein
MCLLGLDDKTFTYHPSAKEIYPLPEIPLQFSCLGDKDLSFELKYQNVTATDELPEFNEERNITTGKVRVTLDLKEAKANLLVTCKDNRSSHTWTLFINGKFIDGAYSYFHVALNICKKKVIHYMVISFS